MVVYLSRSVNIQYSIHLSPISLFGRIHSFVMIKMEMRAVRDLLPRRVFTTRLACTRNALRALSSLPSEVYRSRSEKQHLHHDDVQLEALKLLDRLHLDCIAYSSKHKHPLDLHYKRKDSTWFDSFFGGIEKETSDQTTPVATMPIPKSLYLWGSTGCGKTYLMDLFFDNIPIKKKRRIHFHDFMLDIHKRLHHLKSSNKETQSSSQNKNAMQTSVIQKIAHDILSESSLLCFDEFQVTDIADAMILKALFETMFAQGLVLVATSNRPPVDLYKNGLQRALFVPFIHLLLDKVTVFSFNPGQSKAPVDYRLAKYEQQAKNVYFTPITIWSKARVEDAMLDVCNVPALCELDITHRATSVSVYGHKLHINWLMNGRRCAKFAFSELCSEAYGAADFIALGRLLSTIALTDVQHFQITNRNEMRRFITLIDALYENKVHLIVEAVAAPQSLLLSDDTTKSSQFDELFAFDRTVSRLLEMQSVDYVRECATARPDGISFLVHSMAHLTPQNFETELKKAFSVVWAHYRINADDEQQMVNGQYVEMIQGKCMNILLVDFAQLFADAMVSDDRMDNLVKQQTTIALQSALEKDSFTQREAHEQVRQLLKALFHAKAHHDKHAEK